MMNKYRVVNIFSSFGIFLDDEIEADNEIEAKEELLNEIMDNIGNYIDIELEEFENNKERDD